MTRAELYFKTHYAEDGGTWGEMRVSVKNRWNQVIKDMSFDEFRAMKGHEQVRLQDVRSISSLA